MYDFSVKKVSIDLGYFITMTTLDQIVQGIDRQHSGDVIFPVHFNCIAFKIFPRGAIAENSPLLPPGLGRHYHHAFFRNEKSIKLEKGTVVRFVVLVEKYDEAEKDFLAVSLDGVYLGPIS